MAFGATLSGIGGGMIVLGATLLTELPNDYPLDDRLMLAGASAGAGLTVALIGLPFMLVRPTTDISLAHRGAKQLGEPFAIDKRPKTLAPRLWLGEF